MFKISKTTKSFYANVVSLIHKKPYLFICFFISFLAFYINSTYVNYPDEFVNMLGGKIILQGHIPYKDFFDHHMPFAWYLSSFIQIFTLNSYVHFRIFYAFLTFVLSIWLYYYIYKKHTEISIYVLIFITLLPFIQVYFWLHLFLADSLSALFSTFAFFILYTFTNLKNISKNDIIIASIFIHLVLFSSLSYIFIFLLMCLWFVYIAYIHKKHFLALLLLVLPWLIYLLYLVLTKSFQDFYFANIIYNSQYYVTIANYTKGEHINPIKLGLTILFNFYQSFISLLTATFAFNMYLPYTKFIALGSTVAIITSIYKKPIFGLFLLLLLGFTSPRGSVENISETSYQQGVFLLLGFAIALISIRELLNLKLSSIFESLRQLIGIILLILLGFSIIYLSFNTYTKWFMRYTAKMPYIYDKAPKSEFLNDILFPSDTYFIGPYEPQESYFVKAIWSGKYPSLLPQFRESDLLSKSFINEQTKYNPAIVVYKEDASIFGTPAKEFGEFYLNYLKIKYTRLSDVKEQSFTVIKNPFELTLTTSLWIRNDRVKEYMQRLKEKGYIQ